LYRYIVVIDLQSVHMGYPVGFQIRALTFTELANM
jgi:hypothetical protein